MFASKGANVLHVATCGKGRGKRQEDKRTGQKMEAENYI